MKNENINFTLIILIYFVVGFLINQEFNQNIKLQKIEGINTKITIMKSSIDRLVLLELISEEQFNIIVERIKNLEKNQSKFSFSKLNKDQNF